MSSQSTFTIRQTHPRSYIVTRLLQSVETIRGLRDSPVPIAATPSTDNANTTPSPTGELQACHPAEPVADWQSPTGASVTNTIPQITRPSASHDWRRCTVPLPRDDDSPNLLSNVDIFNYLFEVFDQELDQHDFNALARVASAFADKANCILYEGYHILVTLDREVATRTLVGLDHPIRPSPSKLALLTLNPRHQSKGAQRRHGKSPAQGGFS